MKRPHSGNLFLRYEGCQSRSDKIRITISGVEHSTQKFNHMPDEVQLNKAHCVHPQSLTNILSRDVSVFIFL